ncbi:hypothetical protein THARTR1_00308 [Trichoderma harzianum]|uniref:Uncharacterized protein n=1 Tax=Trichoderma harzianum TaxID=5544 RepID=A0A2K0UR80_TRIHA|nr:hypothetical protein THARTR1_00308 [Trichoderma harzianum]
MFERNMHKSYAFQVMLVLAGSSQMSDLKPPIGGNYVMGVQPLGSDPGTSKRLSR